MIVFVSYARQDNDLDALRRIERQVSMLGWPYLDDLVDHGRRNRRETVENALRVADSFVAVLSPNYLRTTWTRKEFEFAVRREIHMLALRTDGTFIEQSPDRWPWKV